MRFLRNYRNNFLASVSAAIANCPVGQAFYLSVSEGESMPSQGGNGVYMGFLRNKSTGGILASLTLAR